MTFNLSNMIFINLNTEIICINFNAVCQKMATLFSVFIIFIPYVVFVFFH